MSRHFGSRLREIFFNCQWDGGRRKGANSLLVTSFLTTLTAGGELPTDARSCVVNRAAVCPVEKAARLVEGQGK